MWIICPLQLFLKPFCKFYHHFHAAHIRGLDVRINFNWINLWFNSSLTLCLFNFCILSDNSHWPPTKFLLLSLHIDWVLKHFAMNLQNDKIKLSVERSPANSLYKAREANLNIDLYCLNTGLFVQDFLENLTNTCPK